MKQFWAWSIQPSACIWRQFTHVAVVYFRVDRTSVSSVHVVIVLFSFLYRGRYKLKEMTISYKKTIA